MSRIASLGLVAVVVSFAHGVVACSGGAGGGSSGSGGPSSSEQQGDSGAPEDSGTIINADTGSFVQADSGGSTCSTVQCGATCCASGQTCQSGKCTDPAPSCPLSFSDSTCDSCFKAQCGASCGACAGNSECDAALSCYASCTTSACVSACFSSLSATATNLLNGLLGDPNGCVFSSCRAECTKPAANGDPCLVSADCASGECAGDGVHEGWCTVTGCTSNPQCGIDSAGGLVWCGEVKGGSYACFPGCNSNADCAGFYCASTGTAATCGSDLSVNGYDGNVCACW